MNQEKIGKLIKKIRKEHGLTQAQFAEKYGVTFQAVSKWENGKNMPDVSLIKEISKDFNIDINDLLEGNLNKKRKKTIYILLVTIVFFIIIIINNQNTFSFKTLSSQCSNYNITGSIAYNNKKSSIYISDIKYCGKHDDEKLKKIKCTLYEKNGNKKKVISSKTYNKDEPIKLEEYLKQLEIKIDDYNRTCKKYTKDSLYLEIKTVSQSMKQKVQIIPLSLNKNC